MATLKDFSNFFNYEMRAAIALVSLIFTLIWMGGFIAAMFIAVTIDPQTGIGLIPSQEGMVFMVALGLPSLFFFDDLQMVI